MISLLYIEIDVICIIIVGIVLIQTVRDIDRSTAQRRFAHLCICFLLYFLSDLVWFAIDGNYLPFTLTAAWIANIVYFSLTALMGYLWVVYSETVQRNPHVENLARRALWFIPALVIIVLSVASPWTGWLFTVDATGGYSRGSLYIIQPILLFIYAFATAVKALSIASKTDNYSDKREFNTLASFIVLPVICGCLQIAIEGFDLLYPGIALSVLWVYIDLQRQQISIDPLTQINNRSQLIKQLSVRMRDESSTLYLLMIDADDFKQINDTYGHPAGDQALIRIANALKRAASGRNCFIARYGGDEFIAIAKAVNDEDVEQLKIAIQAKLDELNDEEGTPYRVSVSIGYTKWHPSMKSMQELIAEADTSLYAEKRARKAQRAAQSTL